MSKIYEALLRAEMDRLAGGVEPHEGDGQTRPAINGSRENVGNNTSNTEAVSQEPGFPSVKATDVIESPLVLKMSELRRSVWAPEVSHLPALEERGGVVEQLRSLRSRLYQFRDLNTLKTVAVCSGLPEEGKSFIALNLALSLARHKSARVLLIDGDMRRGTLYKRLGTTSEPGLTDYLSGRSSLPEVMQQPLPPPKGTLPAGLASLTFIASGADADNAADLSGNSRFPALLASVRDFFDWVVVDTSPVNLIADGINLARVCDGVLLITRGGVTRFQTAQRAVQELKTANVLGVVLNAMEDIPATDGYYGYNREEK